MQTARAVKENSLRKQAVGHRKGQQQSDQLTLCDLRMTRRHGRLLNEFVNYKALEPLNQNGCNNKNINIIHNVTAACLASGCEIVSLCDVFPLHRAERVLPNQVSTPFVVCKTVLKSTE